MQERAPDGYGIVVPLTRQHRTYFRCAVCLVKDRAGM